MGMYSELDKYTISVFTLIDNGFDFGLRDYPIFDESYRSILNTAILNHYMSREICCANPAEFKYKLNARMSLIMRNRFNALYSQKAKEFNPLWNHNMEETYSRNLENNGQSSSNGTVNNTSNNSANGSNTTNSTTNTNETVSGSNKGKQINSNFPSEEMLQDALPNTVFVSNASFQDGSNDSTDNTQETSTSNNTSNSTNTGTSATTNNSSGTSKNDVSENYTRITQGSSDSYDPNSAMLKFKKYISSYNLDEQVIQELGDLFMNIF